MRDLIELAQVVNRHKTKSLRTLDNHAEDRVIDFYNKILDGVFKNDDAASNFYFGKDSSYHQYRRLKNKLKDRLWNSVVFVDVNSPKFSSIQKAFYTCHKNLVIIKILLGRYARTSAIDLINRTLKYSRKYEFSEISLELCRFLRRHHAIKTGRRSEYEKYRKEVKDLEKVVHAENVVAECLEAATLELLKSTKPSKQYFEVAEHSISILKDIRTNTFRYLVFSGDLIVTYHLHRRNYEQAIQESDHIIDQFRRKKYLPTQLIIQFVYHKIIAYAELRDYKMCLELYEDNISLFEVGVIRWYNIKELMFLLQFQQQQYGDAIETFREVVTNDTFKNQSVKRQESWKLFNAYLIYLQEKNIISSQTIDRGFRLNKFLNEVPLFSSDKMGHNIPVLIIQIIFLIHYKKYDDLNERIEAIEKYTTRYLRRDNNFRSNCFIKMLLQIPKRQFHRKAAERHARPYLSKLLSLPLGKADQPFEIEIIPYETLWEYVLESLDNRFH